MVNYSIRFLAGTLILFCLAICARVLGPIFPLDQLVIAIILGLIFGNTTSVVSLFEPGITAYKVWLEVGIVLLGAQLVISDLISTGPFVFILVLLVMGGVFGGIELVGRFLGINPRMRALLGAGSGICGVSAIVAVASGIRAQQEEIAYAITTILIFDAVTLGLYPLIGAALDLESVVFGIWAGSTMFSTGPVAAAGFAHSPEAGTWSVITKLVRNSLLGFVVVWFSIRFAEVGNREGETWIGWEIWQSLPKFVIGFFLLASLSNANFFSSDQLSSIEHASQWAFLVAFVGLGFDLQITKMRNVTLLPVFVTVIVFMLMSLLTLGVLLIYFH